MYSRKWGGGVHTERTPSKTTTITNKTRPAGSFFPPAWQAVRLAGPVFYVYVFSLGVSERNHVLVSILRKTGQGAKRLEAALLETPLDQQHATGRLSTKQALRTRLFLTPQERQMFNDDISIYSSHHSPSLHSPR